MCASFLVSGLGSRPDLNGAIGVVGSYTKSTDRFAMTVVQIDSNEAKTEQVKIKQEKLHPVGIDEAHRYASALWKACSREDLRSHLQQICKAARSSFAKEYGGSRIFNFYNLEGLCFSQCDEHERAIESYSRGLLVLMKSDPALKGVNACTVMFNRSVSYSLAWRERPMYPYIANLEGIIDDNSHIIRVNSAFALEKEMNVEKVAELQVRSDVICI